MSEWIRVEDRMPPDGEWVIVAAKDSAGKKFVECDIRWRPEDKNGSILTVATVGLAVYMTK